MSHSDNRPSRDISEYPAVQNIDDLREAEQALRERERLLDSLMGVLPGSAYRALADEHWNVLFISKGIEEVTGYPPDEFTSRRLNYNDLMLPEDRAATREASHRPAMNPTTTLGSAAMISTVGLTTLRTVG